MTDSGIVHAITPAECGTARLAIGSLFIFPNLIDVSSCSTSSYLWIYDDDLMLFSG